MFIVNYIWPVTSNFAGLIDGHLVFFSRLVIFAEWFVGVIKMRIFYTLYNYDKNTHPGPTSKYVQCTRTKNH